MSNSPRDDLAARVVSGSALSITGSIITWGLGATRLVLLTRYLLPADVGVSAQALIFVTLAVRLQTMGLHQAYIQHRGPDERVLRTFFTLRLGLLLSVLLVLALATPWLIRAYPSMPLLGPVLMGYIGVELLALIPTVQVTILTRQLAFRRLAIADVAASSAMTIVAPTMAILGFGVWALVGEALSATLARGAVTWTWWPRLGWDRQAARHFWRYGKALWSSSTLTHLIDNFDDFWVGLTLGRDPLGLYARAYEFARYPRRVVAAPLLDIFLPTYARLQDESLRLSRAFFRASSLMVRSGFLFGLLFVSASPHVITIINEAWLPMVPTLQLMIIYTLVDPLQVGAANLLVATGRPERVTRTRLIQALLFLPAVVIGARVGGISGVAVALDLMVLLGAWLLFREARRVVQYSARALWLWPAVALGVSAFCLWALERGWTAEGEWGILLAKLLLGTLVFGAVLWWAERDALLAAVGQIWALLRRARNLQSRADEPEGDAS